MHPITLSIAALGLVISLPASAASDIVISQIYGGGGNSGAPYTHDYIELFNRGSAPLALNGWSLQYASATGSGNFGATTSQVTELPAITLQPGQYLLVREATQSATGAALPMPDVTDATPIAMAASGGKVALVNTTTALGCNGSSAQPCSSAALATIIDLAGYGSANFYEGGGAAPAASNTAAVFRAGSGCQDTDNNNTDFTAATPAPRNSASALNPCGGAPVNQPIITSCPALSLSQGSAGSVALSASDADSVVNNAAITAGAVSGISLGAFASAASDGDTASVPLNVASSMAAGSYTVEVTFSNNEVQNAACTVNVTVATTTSIPAIQGNGAISPKAGQPVFTQGIVTKLTNNGFFLQDQAGDSDATTSDGIFVFTSTSPTVNVGDSIRLSATVAEFKTGSGADAVANPVTELISPSGINVVATGVNLTPTVITFPEVNEGDLERYEGMLVTIDTPLTASQNFFEGRYGQVTLAAEGRLLKPTNLFPAGSAEAVALANSNARRRIILDDGTTAQNPNPIPYIGADNTLRAGDTVASVTGVIDYGLATNSSAGLSDYKIQPTITPVFSRDNPRTAAPASVGGNVKIASFNVLNYFTTFTNGDTASGQTGQGCTLGTSTSAANCRGANNLAEFTRQRDKIVSAIKAIDADAVGLMEIQNNGNIGLQNLVDSLNAAMGAGTYTPVALPAGGTGTDAIRVAMIYKASKLAPVGDAISDTDSVHNRPPLAQTFTALNGEKFSVVVNHFKSKGSCPASGDPNADQGDGQGCWNALRVQQSQALLSFVNARSASVGDNDVLVIGDLNAYGKEDPVLALTNNGLVDELARVNSADYSYVFDGEAGYLDHALATASFTSQISGTEHWHVNADEPSVIDYNTEFKQPACATCSPDLYTPTPYRSSDHDPVLVGVNLVKALTGTSGRDNLIGTAGDDSLTGGAGADTLTGGAGRDQFVYNSATDGVDTITDFQIGADLIVLTKLLQSLGIASAAPLADGYVLCSASGANALISIDPDAMGAARSRALILVKNTNCSSLATAAHFVFPPTAPAQA